MAKPIESTPILKGKEARDFIRKMAKKEKSKITKKEREIFKAIMEIDGKPRCQYCGKAMKNQKDSKTGKVSLYLYACNCKGYPAGIIASVG